MILILLLLFWNYFWLCVQVYVHVHVCVHPSSCRFMWCTEAKGRCFPQYFFSALSLKQTFTEPGSCQFRQWWWSGGPKDPRGSSFQVLYYRQAQWYLAFLHGIWELNSDLHTSIASSLLTEPSPQPLFQNFWVLSTSLWRLSKLRKGGVQM